MVSNLVGVGEETGDLQSMMGKVADYYDEEVDEATKKLLNLMEPAIIIFMAVFVVIIVLGHLPADDQHDQGIRQISLKSVYPSRVFRSGR